MKLVKRNGFAACLLAGFGTVAACGQEPASQAKVASAGDNEVVTHEDAVNVMAVAVCNRYDTCKGYGPDQRYPSEEACQSDQKDKWSSRWNDDKCLDKGHGPLAGKVRECEQRAKTSECSDNLLDKASEWSECNGMVVCR